MIDKAARGRAQELMRDESMVDITQPDFERPTNPAQLEALKTEIKARRYVLFADMTDTIISKAEAIRSAQPNGGFPPSPYRDRADDRFGKLRLDALKVFIESAESLEGTEAHQSIEALAEIYGKLDQDFGYTYPLGQLAAGSDTAITTMLGLLKNLPAIVSHHEPEHNMTAEELQRIATNSVGLPWNIAMISVNQMMALQTTTVNQLLHQGWAEFDFNLNPGYFRLTHDDSGQVKSVKFNNFSQMLIPESYRYMREDTPLAESMFLKDIPARGPGTIGCPITLLPQKLHRLWGWFIDDIHRDGLWTNSNLHNSEQQQIT